jgi:hypothetical protein
MTVPLREPLPALHEIILAHLKSNDTGLQAYIRTARMMRYIITTIAPPPNARMTIHPRRLFAILLLNFHRLINMIWKKFPYPKSRGGWMPSFEAHCILSEKRTGQSFEELHRWIDEPREEYGPDHRIKRHSYNKEEAEFISSKWGDKAVVEWLFHIAIDNLVTAYKFSKKTYGDKTFNYFRIGISPATFVYMDIETLSKDALKHEFRHHYYNSNKDNHNSEFLFGKEEVKPGYPRARFPWTKEEEETLQREYSSGVDLEEIIRTHERTPGGIIGKLKNLHVISNSEAREIYYNLIRKPIR